MANDSQKIALITEAFGSGNFLRDGVNYTVRCPKCNDKRIEKRKLTIRIDNGLFHCWVCELRGKNVFRYILKNYPRLSSKINGEFLDLHFSIAKEENLLEDNLKVEPPEKMVPVLRKTINPDIIAVRKYLYSRGITNEQIYRWRVMVSPDGKYRRSAIFPSFDYEGKINYFVSRYIDKNITFKYRNSIIPKNKIIFNDIDIDWSKPINLVEGIFDAINCPENTIPILGSSLPADSELFKKIVNSESNITIALDPDLKIKAYDLANNFYKMGCDVKITFAPDGKDLGDLSREEVKNILESAKPIDSLSKLKYKITTIRSSSLI